MSDILNKSTRARLSEKSRRRREKNGKTRRTTTPTALPKTVTAIILRNGGPEYDPAKDPDATLHVRHGDAPEWSYQDRPGYPGKYDPDYHPFAAVQMLAEGASTIELALEFGVYPATVYRWLKEHEEFALAVNHGQVLTKAWWLREGRKQLSNPKFNNGLYALHMANRFGWTKRQETLLNAPGALTNPDDILPPELRPEEDQPEIEVANTAIADDAGRTAEILSILMQAGALPAPKPAEDDDDE